MKKNLLSIKLFVLFLLASSTAMGQYTGSFPNVAALKVATAMDSIAGFEPSKAVDNSLVTYCAIVDPVPAWLQIDLGSPHFIDGFGWDLPNDSELPKTYTIQGSLEGTVWRNVKDGVSTVSGPYDSDLKWPGDYQYIRVYITEKDARASFSEVYIFGEALELPTPPTARPATEIGSNDFVANWGERTTARSYILEVATDVNFFNPVPGYEGLDVGDTLSHQVIGLSPSTQYYYRVRSNNAVGESIPSNRISVTTLKAEQTISFDSIPTYSYGDANFDLTATASSALSVSYESSDEAVATISGSTVTILTVGTTTVTATQEGNAEYQAATPVSWELVVNLKELTVTDAIAENKVYDGTSGAVVSGALLNGVVGTEDVVLVDADTGMFAQTVVGVGIDVATSMSISGADIGNYTLLQPLLVADITARELTVTGAVAESKVYNGNTDATVTGGVLEGVLDGEDVSLEAASLGEFASSDVGTGIKVSASMTLSGTDTSNYSLIQPILVADITAKDLLVTAEDKSREACEANPAFTLIYSGFAGTEDETVLDPLPLAETTADENSGEGNYPITVSGGGTVNYTLTYVDGNLTVTPDVTDPDLTTLKNFEVQLVDGTATITPDDLVISAMDNCGVVDTTLSQSTFTGEDVGNVLVNVTISDEAGNSTSAPVIVKVQGTNGFGELAEFGVNIYPNPTAGNLELATDTPIDNVKVMDMTGKTVLQRSDVGQLESFDLSGFSDGIYIFQLKIGNELMHLKIVKK